MPLGGHIDNLITGIGVLAVGGVMDHRSSGRPHHDGNEPPDDGGPPPEVTKQVVSKLWIKIVFGIALGGWSLFILIAAAFGHWFLQGQEEARKQGVADAAAIYSQVKALSDRMTGANGVCERLTTVEANQKQVMKGDEELWHHVNDLEKQKR